MKRLLLIAAVALALPAAALAKGPSEVVATGLGWAVWFARARWTSAIRTPSVS
jgi:hypothetical protein